jgi:hypothetical protein
MDAQAADGRLGFMMPTGYEHRMAVWADNRKVTRAN